MKLFAGFPPNIDLNLTL